jgi:exonuclease SbcC
VKLRRLSIERLAGIDRPFTLDEKDLGDGLNIIVGPNGVGKSRLCAAVRALLWRERRVQDGGLAASAVFEHQSAPWRVVRDGSHHRWQCEGIDAGPPALPGERLDGCFFLGLRELLDDSDRAGRDLASEIRRQMSGGFDLDAVKQRFEESVPARIGSKETKALSAAETEIRKAEWSQIEVKGRERELESLKTRAAEAERALHRLVHYETARSLESMRGDHAQRERDLAELPEALAHLDGTEVERLEKIEDDLARKRREREDADTALSASREAARATRLEEPLAPTSLATWRERAEQLAELEHRLESAREHARATREAALVRQQALGSHARSDAAPALAIEDDFELFAFLRESHQLATERAALTERLRLLAAREFSDDDARRLELLRRGVEPLRAWLRAPDPALHATAVTLWPSRALYIVAGLVLAAIGSGMQLLAPSLPVAIAGIAAGIALAVAGLLSRAHLERLDATDWRSIAEQQFPGALAPPGSWSAAAVAERLRQLEDELAKLDADEMRARDRAVERGLLEESVQGLADRAAALEGRRHALADRLGLDALRPDAEMVDVARALDASRAAHAEARSAAAKRDELEDLRRGLLEQLAAFLTGLGEDQPGDPASARAGVHSLDARDRTLRSAHADAIREEQNRDRLDREIARLDADKSAIFQSAGIEANDRAELTRRLDELTRYRELKNQRADLATRIERAEADLAAAGESALARRDVTRLAEEQAALKRASDDRESLNRRIGEISESARSAREGHTLEDAIATKNAALSALRDRLDDALAAAAGALLIDRVRHEHEVNQMPRVLERARTRFGTFTHHCYELNVSPSDGGSFVAVDAKSGAGLSLDKLSDGTRGQLILAARLAFAEEAEQGADLPLFLDEALDHSDPERFHAIARSLARMVVDEGRQVFYLSNDPTDVQRFVAAFTEEECDQVKVIDLGEIRGQAARVDGPEALHVAPLAAVPDPGGENAESYGAAIGVAPLDPSCGPRGQHLYYVLRDDLPLLHQLLLARVETVGQCRALVKGGSAVAKHIAEASEVGAQLDARIALLETFCLAWCEGRGKTMGRAELEESGAVTEKYLGAVVEVAAELDGDAERLVAALRERSDPRLSGYRSKSADELERFFVERGHIDDKPVLGETQIVERAIGTPAAHQLSPRIAAGLLHEWWSLSEHAR